MFTIGSHQASFSGDGHPEDGLHPLGMRAGIYRPVQKDLEILKKNERFQVNCIGNYQAKLLKCKEQGQNGGLAFGSDIDLCLQSISFAQDSVVEKTAMARNGETFSDGLRSSETKAAGDLMS